MFKRLVYVQQNPKTLFWQVLLNDGTFLYSHVSLERAQEVANSYVDRYRELGIETEVTIDCRGVR